MYDTDIVRDSDVDLADLLLTDISPELISGEINLAEFFFVDSSANTPSENCDIISDAMDLPSDVMPPGSCACISMVDMDLSPSMEKSLIQINLMNKTNVIKSKYFEDLNELSEESMSLTTSGTFVDDLFKLWPLELCVDNINILDKIT